MTYATNHDQHDLDLIAAYASGEIDPRAEDLVGSCAGCRVEFDLQRQVREWLVSAPMVTMADHERSALHHRVTAQLGHVLKNRRAGARRFAPSTLLVRLGAAAAGLAVVLGLSGVMGQLGFGGATAATTTLAATEAVNAQVTDEASGLAASTTAAPSADYGLASMRSSLIGGDADAVREEAKALAEELNVPTYAGQATDRVAAPPCVDQIEGLTPLLWAESLLDGEPIVIIVVEGEDQPEALVYRLDTCELVDLS
jgi:hypothetical protein